MRKVLVANRAEIAARVLSACREMGLETVAVFSDADAALPYLAMADEAWRLGPGPAPESYLNMERLLEIAKSSGCDAVHPGYGFLSENAEFSRRCAEQGITFIGPPPSAIRALGDKVLAKRTMQSAGVPVAPGYHGDDQREETLLAEASKIGWPVLIKAAAGGGGRGMRVCRSPEEMPGLLQQARSEALAGFGDDRLLLERYVENPRHVEVQIFGDAHGNVVHLFERECSIQRRHQKILEESPSCALSNTLRKAVTDAAVLAGRTAGYIGAGTVEFLLEERPDGPRFYFLEVNTRLQVEHPVTEMLTGIDLVKLQLRIADGEPLGLSQDDIRASGHVVEARIYAEDPAAGFLPSIGTITHWSEPKGPWVRVDSGYEQGSEVSPYYDPQLAKVIVRGETRDEANRRMVEALRRFIVLGVTTNIPLLLDTLQHPEYAAGRITTRFLPRHFADWRPHTAATETDVAAAAVSASSHTARPPVSSARAETAWHTSDGWRIGGRSG
jgi:acetyl-CoA carboxylase biotin carboxylase subunit